jgi:hypothetical protein
MISLANTRRNALCVVITNHMLLAGGGGGEEGIGRFSFPRENNQYGANSVTDCVAIRVQFRAL